MGCQFIQINLHHNKAVLAHLCQKLPVEEINIALIQKPLVYGDRISGLCNRRGTQFSAGPYIAPRSCIFVRNTFHAFLLSVLCFRDVTMVRVTCTSKGSNCELIVTAAYLCCGSDISPLTDRYSYSRNKMQFIIGCSGNARCIIWWSMDIILLGESLMQYLFGTEPNILNEGNEPIFVVSSRKENTVD
jgi:hypothetical protein